jgi:hypothetical protein
VKICSGNQTLTAAGFIVVPVDTRVNPLNVAGSITDTNVSTYALFYSTADVFAAGYTAAGDTTKTAIPGTPPTTGSHGFSMTGQPATAIILQVTATSGTGVTLNAVFQADSTVGA